MSTRLSLSIALAAYNGERYIGEQLDSIMRQTRLPDELVISDDASIDTTLDIVGEFARRAPFPVRIYENRERLGSTRNFEKSIRACSGDIIFLCDQDDVWYSEKIVQIEKCFMNDEEAGVVFTDADVVNQNLDPFGPRLWKRFRFNLRKQAQVSAHDAFAVLLKHFVVTGATMAFRSSYRDLVLPIPEEWTHDGWIALLISASSHLIALPIPLIAYRQHGSNQIGTERSGKNRDKNCAAYYGPRVLSYELARTRMLEFSARISNAEYKIHCLDEKIGFLRACAELPDERWRRLPLAIRELAALRYHRYAKKGIGSFFSDLLRRC